LSAQHTPNVELDAALVSAGYEGGRHGFFGAALRLGFESPDAAIARAEWLKSQSAEYVQQVVAKAAEGRP
jgi:hypothetical protein